MKKVLFSLLTLAVVVGFTSCGMSAGAFNDKLVASQKTIFAAMEKFSTETQSDNVDEATIKLQGDTLLTTIDSKIAELKELKAPKGGEEFKESAIATFEAYRKIIEVELKGVALGEDTNVDEYNAYVEEYNKVTSEGSDIEDQFLTKQREFASANNMRLER